MKKLLIIFTALLCITVICSCKPKDTVTKDPSVPQESTEAEENLITKNVTFYFPDEDVMYLCPEVIPVTVSRDILVESVVCAVINGPVSKELRPSVSGNVQVLSVSVDDGLCTVDLSKEFSEYNTGGTTKETMAVYSLVNTLCGLDEIQKVKINIDGNESPDFGGHFDLSEPFEADLTLIKN